jgi:hypothetical protein
VAVFDRKDLADALVAGREDGYDGYQVEEYPLNPGESEYHAGRSLWSVRMRRDGTVISADDMRFAHTEAAPPDSGYDSNGGTWRDWKMCLKIETWARDKEQAVKAANEIRAQRIADGWWDRAEAEFEKERRR